MRTAIEFIEYLKSNDVKLSLSGDNIAYDAPKGVITSKIKNELKRRKAEIISYLELEATPDETPLKNSIVLGDCQNVLKNIPDNVIDCIVTDPPYGYSFMGKDWDKALPKFEVWKECLRILKPGAFAFIMSGSRQDVLSRSIFQLENAGFRVDFSPTYWVYAQGFPKSHNITNKITEEAGAEKKNIKYNRRQLNGSYAGFQPKPAVEVIIIAMKPLSEDSYYKQAQSNAKGITWLDDCRIPSLDTENKKIQKKVHRLFGEYSDDKGRFPANLLVSEEALGSISKYFDLDVWSEMRLPFLTLPKPSKSEKEAGLEGCPHAPIKGRDPGQDQMNVPFKLRANPRKNPHPTIKPLKLMAYLITMASREGDAILDPFCGTGTTCIAAMMLKRNFIGVEISPEYHQIAMKRLEYYRQETASWSMHPQAEVGHS